MPRNVSYPLEGTGSVEEVCFYIYDKAGRRVWGELRIRREKNPDTLTQELRPLGATEWKPLIRLTAHNGQMFVATFGIHGGHNADSDRTNEVARTFPNQGREVELRNDSHVLDAAVRKDESDPNTR